MIGDALSALLDDLRAACDLADEVWPHETVRVALVPANGRRWFAVVVRENPDPREGHGDLIETGTSTHPGDALADLMVAMRRLRDSASGDDGAEHDDHAAE